MAKRKPKFTLAQAADSMRAKAMEYPDTVEDHPWGESAFKVKKKVFLFMFCGTHKDETFLNLTMKLPESNTAALQLPFASRTGYGLGKSGWITSRFNPGDAVPLDLLYEWLDESFRAIAPAKVVAKLDH
jgi:predicted DNA-binding protein (MmcQ/YjbR family)